MAPSGSFRSLLGASIGVFAVAAYGCTTTATSPPIKVKQPEAIAVITGPVSPVTIKTKAGFIMEPASFDDISGWTETDVHSARNSFLETCNRWTRLKPDRPLSFSAPYGGTIGQWLPICKKLENIVEADDILPFFETQFTPLFIKPETEKSKLTGYFEPELEVRYFPEPGFTKAVPGIPGDLIRAEPSKFEKKFPSGKMWGRVVNGELEKYPDRSEIYDSPDKALGYASAGKVFYLQIQGSGRLRFPDGRTVRAAFAAHNHKPFVSIARHLIDTGQIETHQAGMNSILNWMEEVGPEIAQSAMNVNPRYVWFAPEEIKDPNKGPKGAQGVPLTPMSSMAVDPRYHPYGVPIFLDTKVPSQPGDWKGQPYRNLVIAQDTGGDIKGILRGDLFFGWGDTAGGRAASMNHDVAMWALLPKGLVKEMTEKQMLAGEENG